MSKKEELEITIQTKKKKENGQPYHTMQVPKDGAKVWLDKGWEEVKNGK